MNRIPTCPIGVATGQRSIIATTILDDPDMEDTRCVEVLAGYFPKPLTLAEIRRHRKRQCSCVGLTVSELTAHGEETSDPLRRSPGAPKGWEPGVKYDQFGIPAEITTQASVPLATEEDWLGTVKAMGINLPDGYTVRLLSASYDPGAWHRDRVGEDAVTRPVWRYKFSVIPTEQVLANADEIMDFVTHWKPPKGSPLPATGHGHAYMVCYGDMQIGKKDALGGTEQTVERILDKTHLAVLRLKELRRSGMKIDTIYIPILGDCVEGATSQGGRLMFRQDIEPLQQVRVYRRILLHIIKTFAPLASQIILPVVDGNHDEATRIMITSATDGFATDGASAVADALEMNPSAFGHVSFVFPHPDTKTVTVDAAGTIVGFAHGHGMKGGAEKYWANAAHNRQPVGEASLLITAHFHHLKIVQSGVKTWMQIPALDNGSQWFTNSTGNEAPAGLLTLTVGDDRWDNVKVL